MVSSMSGVRFPAAAPGVGRSPSLLCMIDSPDATLLDRTQILYGSNLGNGNNHDTKNLPVLLAGGGFKHGQHLTFDKKNNYPQLGATAVINNAEAMTKRFDTLFLFSSNASDYATGIVSLLSKLKSEGKINNKVVLLSVADQFGADLNAAGSKAFKDAGFDVVLNKTYPMASRDLSAEMKQAQDSGADSFVAFSYPPDTFLIAAQAQTLGYNPKVYYTAVGTAFPAYKAKLGDKAQGILGAGGWDRC